MVVATLKEVAKRAGVDPSVVSRVVNNKAVNIRTETRTRVLDAIKELNYEPNQSARSLKQGGTRILGMIIPDFRNSVYAEIIQGAQHHAATLGYSLMVYSLFEEKQSTISLRTFKNRVDGLLIACSEIEDDFVYELSKEDLPFVLVNRLVAEIENYVVTNDLQGSRVAVKHLASLGHQKIAHISGPLYTGTGLQRLQGYRLALKDYEVEFNSSYIIESTFSIEGGYSAMKELLYLPNPPTAVFAANIMICLGAMKAIQENGLAIPEQLSIICIHDVYFAETLNPPLTTIKMPLYEMGTQSVDKLISIIQGKDNGSGIILPDTQLIQRKSTARVSS